MYGYRQETKGSPVTISLRGFARFAIGLLLVCIISLAIVFWILKRNPEALIAPIIETVKQEVGVTLTLDSVDVVLFPIPVLSVSNVSIKGEGLEVLCAYATIMPNFLSLLSGDIVPSNISLLRPNIKASVPVSFFNTSPKNDKLFKIDNEKILLSGARLKILQANAHIMGNGNTGFFIENLSCDLKVNKKMKIKGEISFSSLQFLKDDTLITSLDNVRSSGELYLLNPIESLGNLTVKGSFFLRDICNDVNFSFVGENNKNIWNIGTSIYGNMQKRGVNIPFRVKGDISGDIGTKKIQFTALDVNLDRDKGRIDGILDLSKKQGFAFDGNMHIARLSLTQWLGFARELSPGLQHSLDNIVDSNLSFHIDEKGLKATDIVTNCAGSTFSGFGGVANWQRPVIDLELKADHVDLGKGIPEAIAVLLPELSFSHIPLTDNYDEVFIGPKPKMFLGYNIRLGSKKVDYGPVKFTDVNVNIIPDKEDDMGQEPVLIKALANLYGGNLSGSCKLSGYDTTIYDISVNAKGVKSEDFVNDLDVIPLKNGYLRGDLQITTQGTDIKTFLEKLRGVVRVHADKGAIKFPQNSNGLSFETLDIEYRPSQSDWENKTLGLNGQWAGVLKHENYDLRANAIGKLQFSDKGLDFNKLAIKSKLNFAKLGLFKNGLDLEIGGDLSCQSNPIQLEIQNARLKSDIIASDASGNCKINVGRNGLIWQGDISLVSHHMTNTIEGIINKKISLHKYINKVKLDTNFKFDSDGLQLDAMKLAFDKSNINGKLKVNIKNLIPDISFSLACDNLELERYMEKKKIVNQKKEKLKPGEKWDFPLMRELSVNGDIEIKRLSNWGYKAQNLKMPIKLEKGLFTWGMNKGILYGANFSSQIKLNFTSGIYAESYFQVDGFDLAKASEDKGGELVFGGKATVHTVAHGQINGSDDFFSNFDGIWRIEINNGSYQAKDKNGNLKGNPTLFNLAKASGNINKGIAKSDNVTIDGDGLHISGNGWFDMENETLDYNFIVDMRGVPEFPLRLYGTIDNTKTSIGAGKLILNTIGGVVKGLFNIIGGLVNSL